VALPGKKRFEAEGEADRKQGPSPFLKKKDVWRKKEKGPCAKMREGEKTSRGGLN